MTFTVAPGEALGVMGESGAGKSTLLNLVLGLLEPTEGRISLEGEPWSPLPERERRPRRPRIQAVFQDPLASLPPHRTGWEILQEPLEIWKRGTDTARQEAAARMAARVRFPEAALDQRPGAWSGGLAQRLCLGRALMLEPALLVLDEPFSALDATLAGHLLEVLLGLKAEGLALLFASHDLAAARSLCDHLLLLRAGEALWNGPIREAWPDPEPPSLRTLRMAMLQVPVAED
ncbi:ATP-binding cassette domain-containing protein [Geothrix terrae]|uniref:ATP-binding cassette domain-containing protein n=1 Tax=Geothrix terrae TaxID=2922720 RepID=UPI001FAC99CE